MMTKKLEKLNGFTIRQDSVKSIDTIEGMEDLLIHLKDKYATEKQIEEIDELLNKIEDAINFPEEQEHGGEEVAYLTTEVQNYIFDKFQLIISSAPGDPTHLYVKYSPDN